MDRVVSACGFTGFVWTEGRFVWKKYVVSKVSGFVWTGPKSGSKNRCSHKFSSIHLNHWSLNRLLPPAQIYAPCYRFIFNGPEEIFKRLLPEWVRFTLRGQRKTQKSCKVDPKISMKILLHYPPAVWHFNPNHLEMLLSAHVRTSEADISRLEQKAAKCSGMWEMDRWINCASISCCRILVLFLCVVFSLLPPWWVPGNK